MTVTIVEVAIMKFFFGTCDCTVDIDVVTGDLSLVLGIWHECGHAHMLSHESPDVDCNFAMKIPKLVRTIMFHIRNHLL